MHAQSWLWKQGLEWDGTRGAEKKSEKAGRLRIQNGFRAISSGSYANPGQMRLYVYMFSARRYST